MSKVAVTHSPLPWLWDDNAITSRGAVLPVEGIGQPHGYPRDAEGPANAEFIVRACNAHGELLAALKAIRSRDCARCGERRCDECRRADTAIAKAEAQS